MREDVGNVPALVRSRASERLAKAIVLAGAYGGWVFVVGLAAALLLLAH